MGFEANHGRKIPLTGFIFAPLKAINSSALLSNSGRSVFNTKEYFNNRGGEMGDEFLLTIHHRQGCPKLPAVLPRVFPKGMNLFTRKSTENLWL